MIRATINGTTLTLRGHAGAAPYGRDLTCAAVSALAYTLAQRLTELEKLGMLEEPPVIRLESGYARLSAKPKEAYGERIRDLFCLIQSGLMFLQDHYPEQVRVQSQEGMQNSNLWIG